MKRLALDKNTHNMEVDGWKYLPTCDVNVVTDFVAVDRRLLPHDPQPQPPPYQRKRCTYIRVI